MSAGKGRNPCTSFRNAVQDLDNTGEIVKGFIVENLPYQECIRRFDSVYLLSELERYKEFINTDKDHLFYDGEVNHVSEMRFNRHFVRLFKGLGMTGISSHSLRHTKASKVTE